MKFGTIFACLWNLLTLLRIIINQRGSGGEDNCGSSFIDGNLVSLSDALVVALGLKRWLITF